MERRSAKRNLSSTATWGGRNRRAVLRRRGNPGAEGRTYANRAPAEKRGAGTDHVLIQRTECTLDSGNRTRRILPPKKEKGKDRIGIAERHAKDLVPSMKKSERGANPVLNRNRRERGKERKTFVVAEQTGVDSYQRGKKGREREGSS